MHRTCWTNACTHNSLFLKSSGSLRTSTNAIDFIRMLNNTEPSHSGQHIKQTIKSVSTNFPSWLWQLVRHSTWCWSPPRKNVYNNVAVQGSSHAQCLLFNNVFFFPKA